jgi:hypothetical protein
MKEHTTKKLVCESLDEFFDSKSVNEGKFKETIGKAKKAVKGAFKKVGKFFMSIFNGKVVPAMPPVNTGIMVKDGDLKFVDYIPNDKDVSLEPSLSSLKSGERIFERIKKEYAAQAQRNKAHRKLQESLDNVHYNNIINEDEVKLPYSGEDKVRNVNSDFLVKRLLLQVKNPKLMPPLIWGAPGIGKTAITKAVIKTLGPGHRLIDVQTSKMAPDDWSLPSIRVYKNEGTEVVEARDVPKNWLPTYEPSDDEEENSRRDNIANDGEGGIIFLDELSRASTEVQNTCLKLVDERIIGDRRLGSKWAIVAASNRQLDDPEGGQTEIGSALANRFQHWNFVPSVDEWITWAKGAKIDNRITTFVDFNRDHFYLFDNQSKVNTTPRTWEALSKMLNECEAYGDIVFSRADLENIIGGVVHDKTVERFIAFLVLLESFSPKDIMMIFTNPEKAPKPKKSGAGYDMVQARALIGVACSQTQDRTLEAKELENYIQYFINLGNASLSAQALWLIVETHPDIHQQTGDIKDGKHDKYKKAMDMFREAYGSIKFSSREEIMGPV